MLLPTQFMAAAPDHGIPSVKDVASSVDGTGIELSGWFATWDTDSTNEAFLPTAFNESLPRALKLGIPVLYHHAKNEPPIGFVKTAEVRPQGLWGSVILPKPTVGTKAFDIYSAVASGLIPLAFSVGGIWQRLNVGGKVKLLCQRLLELSLTPCATNEFAVVSGVQSAVGVKSLGAGLWVPTSMPYKEKVNARVRHMAQRDLERALALLSVELSVREIHAAAHR